MTKQRAEISDALALNCIDTLAEAKAGLARLGYIGSETA